MVIMANQNYKTKMLAAAGLASIVILVVGLQGWFGITSVRKEFDQAGEHFFSP